MPHCRGLPRTPSTRASAMGFNKVPGTPIYKETHSSTSGSGRPGSNRGRPPGRIQPRGHSTALDLTVPLNLVATVRSAALDEAETWWRGHLVSRSWDAARVQPTGPSNYKNTEKHCFRSPGQRRQPGSPRGFYSRPASGLHDATTYSTGWPFSQTCSACQLWKRKGTSMPIAGSRSGSRM